MIKRVFLIVLDSVGVGELPDAADFGDKGANTMHSISKSPEFSAKTLCSLGLGNIEGVEYLGKNDSPLAAYGKCAERSMGKDTTTGHWEISGVISHQAMPTYPNGFPDDILAEFCRQTGHGVICNKPYSGTDVIHDYGDEHLQTGKLIVYTSGDSVFQIAAHESVVPHEKLYEYCRIARKILCGENAVGRVIARPFEGESGSFVRNAYRRDFSLMPTGWTLPDALSDSKLDVISVGKISDIFAGRGITESHPTHSNDEGMKETDNLIQTDFNGLCFVNLVDFDMLYGHRNNVDGYAAAISRFDIWLKDFLPKLQDDDVLIITADHGCDPGDISTDHTREYIPLIVFGSHIKPISLGIRKSYADIAASVADMLGIDFSCEGSSFWKDVAE